MGKNRFRILKKEPGKEIEPLMVEATYLCDVGREIFGSEVYVEQVAMNKEHTMWILIDEDGLSKNLPLNFLLPTVSEHFPIQKIVGTAVFVSSKYCDIFAQKIYDYEVCDLAPQLERTARSIVSDCIQKSLSECFIDYGNNGLFIQPL